MENTNIYGDGSTHGISALVGNMSLYKRLLDLHFGRLPGIKNGLEFARVSGAKSVLSVVAKDMEEASAYLESALPSLENPASFIGANSTEREENARVLVRLLNVLRADAQQVQNEFIAFDERSGADERFIAVLDQALSKIAQQIQKIRANNV